MTPDEIGKLVFDIRCSARGEEFWELFRERCLVGVGIDLTTMRPVPGGDPVPVLDPTLNLSQPYLNLIMGKQSVFNDFDRWSRIGQKACEKGI